MGGEEEGRKRRGGTAVEHGWRVPHLAHVTLPVHMHFRLLKDI